MRLLAVYAMINNRDYFQLLCALLNSSLKEQLQRTMSNTVWDGEVQIQALSIALSHPIYSYTKFNSDPTNRHSIPLNISLQDIVDRFSKGTSGGHLIYIGYKADTNKLAFCLFYNGTHYDALLPFLNNPQQFVPHFDIINMSLWKIVQLGLRRFYWDKWINLPKLTPRRVLRGEKRASAGSKGKLLSALKDEFLGTTRDLSAIIDQLVVIKLFESIVA